MYIKDHLNKKENKKTEMFTCLVSWGRRRFGAGVRWLLKDLIVSFSLMNGLPGGGGGGGGVVPGSLSGEWDGGWWDEFSVALLCK